MKVQEVCALCGIKMTKMMSIPKKGNTARRLILIRLRSFAKKYLDDDTEDADLRITIIKDKETGKEFMIFDSAAGLVVKERNY